MILSKHEEVFLEKFSKNQYMQSIQSRIDFWVKQSGNSQSSWNEVLNHLYEIFESAKDDVDNILDLRFLSGEIKNKLQARRSVLGKALTNTIIYVFIRNKLVGNISENIFITDNKSIIPDFDKVLTINVGEEIEKLDTDLIIFSLKENSKLKKCIVLSLLTSKSARIENTYKWKLLMEIAMSDCEVRDKYEISYNPPTIPLVCFVTVNFYNEINNPQHRGMFKFFDRAFIGKPIDPQSTNFISPLSNLIEFTNENLIESS